MGEGWRVDDAWHGTARHGMARLHGMPGHERGGAPGRGRGRGRGQGQAAMVVAMAAEDGGEAMRRGRVDGQTGRRADGPGWRGGNSQWQPSRCRCRARWTGANGRQVRSRGVCVRRSVVGGAWRAAWASVVGVGAGVGVGVDVDVGVDVGVGVRRRRQGQGKEGRALQMQTPGAAPGAMGGSRRRRRGWRRACGVRRATCVRCWQM